MAANAPEQEQPLTLNFNIGSIPVSVEPWFWLMALYVTRFSPSGAVVVFVSVLLHELGHATAAMAFGSPTRIRLYSFGGLAYHQPLSRWRSIVVALAGPGAGFVLGAVAYYYYWYTPGFSDASWQEVLWTTKEVNIWWGVMNLLPVLPLDGGHVMQGLVGERRFRLALAISALAAVSVVAWGVTHDRIYTTVLFGFLAFGSVRSFMEAPTPIEPVYRERRAPLKPEKAPAVLENGWAQLFAGNDSEAERTARTVLTESIDPALKNRAFDLLAWVMLARADAIGALRQLERVQPQDQVRALTQAMALELAGQLDAAMAPALKANEVEPSDATAQLVLRLLSHAKRYDEAIQLAETFRWARAGARDAALSGLYASRGDHARAAEFAQKAFEVRRRSSDAIDVARHLALGGDAVSALTWLERAFEAGFTDTSVLQSDPDFAPVRALDGYAAMIARPQTRAAG